MRSPRIPFAHAHDQELAGLRDYRAPLEPETPQRWPRWIALIVIVIALLVLYGVALSQYADSVRGVR